MAGILDLPNELLLNIANRLRRNGGKSRTYTSYRNLKQLALTCRRLLPIAQDALYCEVFIRKTDTEQTGPSCIAHFARTLLERPEFALMVKQPHLMTVEEPLIHPDVCVMLKGNTHDSCRCGFAEIVGLCRKFLETAKRRTGLSLHDEAWITSLEQLHEPALLGVILFLTPAVHTLELKLFNKASRFFCEEGHDLQPSTKHVELEQRSGTLPDHPEFAMEQIPGIAKVTRLQVAVWVPTNIIALPQLKTLKLGLLNDRYDVPHYLALPSGQISPTLSSKITRMKIRLNINVTYFSTVSHSHTMYGHLKTTLKGLASLKQLFLQLTSSYKMDQTIYLPQGTYAKVLSTIESESLEHLTMDVCDLQELYTDESGGECRRFRTNHYTCPAA
jgi:hypothetical protein